MKCSGKYYLAFYAYFIFLKYFSALHWLLPVSAGFLVTLAHLSIERPFWKDAGGSLNDRTQSCSGDEGAGTGQSLQDCALALPDL